MTTPLNLLPQPRALNRLGGSIELSPRQVDGRAHEIAITAQPADLASAFDLLRDVLTQTNAGTAPRLATRAVADALITINIGSATNHAEGYRLRITRDAITITGDDAAGAFYGACTLAQIIRLHGSTLPALHIEDYPDFPNRGVMLDISRDKVPTMDTLYGLVDLLASLKYNQLQLYTEHTFAYTGHEDVWRNASPMTAGEIQALDAYCQARFITLVPNQNSFGHMHRWLKHPQYKHMGETEESVLWWLPGAFSISPAVPETIPFLDSLYEELLPNFSTTLFNVGADETFDLGMGRAKQMVEEQGSGRVYLDFLLKIHGLVSKRGRTMMFWGDIINQHPELVPELPKDIIALEWGYEAGHAFDEKSELFAQSGIPFYVCPGTSAWVSLSGRTDNMCGNIRSAAENGLKHGAVGFLNTDWGDRGHWQQMPVSYPGFAYGAAVSWCFAQNADLDLAAALNAHVYQDQAGVLGKLALDLGNTYKETGVILHNSNLLHWVYELDRETVQRRYMERGAAYPGADEVFKNVPQLMENLHATIEYVDDVMANLSAARPTARDAGLLHDEYQQTARMLRHGAKRGLHQLNDTTYSTDVLKLELMEVAQQHINRWLARNRPGGLADSLGRLLKAQALYEQG